MNKIILLFLALPFFGNAQSTTIDSLKTALSLTKTQENSIQKANIVLKLADELISTNQPDTEQVIDLLDAELQPQNLSDSLKATYFKLLGDVYYIKNRFEGTFEAEEKSVENYEQAIPLFQALKDTTNLADVYKNSGVLLKYKQKTKALSYLKAAVLIYKQIEDKHNLAVTYEQLCTLLATMDRVDDAFAYSRKALDLFPYIDDYSVVQISLGIGIAYMDIDRRKEANELFEAAKEAALKSKDEYLIAGSYLYLGGNLVDDEMAKPDKLEEGKAYLDKAYALYDKAGNDFAKYYVNVFYASYNCGKGDYEKALNYSDIYISYMDTMNQPEILASAYFQRGIIFDESNQQDSAAFYFTKNLESGLSTNNHNFIKQAYERLYLLEKENKNFDKALEYHEKYLEYHDSLYNKNLQSIIGEESVKLDLAGEQRARVAAEADAKYLTTINRLYLGIGIGLLLLLGLIGFLYQRLSKTRKQLEAQNHQLTELNSTKDKFFGIIAHDIRSPIVALDGVGEQMNYYLKKNNETKLRRLADRVDSTAKRLSSLLDNLLNWALLQTGTIPYNPNALSLKSVSDDIIALYQPLATTKNISLANNINPSFSVFADESALNTIVRNLVNNALKFTPEGGKVSIDATEKMGKVFIEINDTGTGISAEKLPKLFSIERKSTKGTAGEKGSGLGLMLCKELVELNKGTIQAISELGKGSKFIFSVPVS